MITPATQLTRTRRYHGGCFLAQAKSFVVVVWSASADAASTREMANFTNEALRDHPSISIVHVVEQSAGVPTREGRDGLVATAKSHREQLACVGALLPPTSVLATLMRAFVRAVRTLVRGDLNIFIEQDLEQLAAQMAPIHTLRTGVRITVAEVVGIIKQARREAVPAV